MKKRLALAVTAVLGLATSAATCAARSVFVHQASAGGHLGQPDYAGGKDDVRGHLLTKETGTGAYLPPTWTELLGKFKAKFGGAVMSAKLEAMKKTAAAWAQRAHAKHYSLVMATPAPACG